MRLVWRQQALDDRDRIMNRIGQDNPEAAADLDDVFESKGDIARQRPTLYKKGKVEGTREIVAASNYVIVYTIKDEYVEVLRIIHARQQWP
ncbi:type II toxin-antitoxin system RelE/ParE family toxin [Pseudomonas granadensis]|uniref:type II toxin-antitoxin system RelE/ParE family toxin n=1 Tax=Pseudomonas TaxID=286 RepID=UPI0019D12180|nr:MULTISPECIES: type II toxin-antitoxin system RelE/ParE family toxin [Pseudomonas]MBN6773132.1 type II toxin-antitoxin system RelE/ParE family toxin [Pseudomonas granadensis]MBN6803682.1 type II toxin-antitoxin system RelE/ParE family toxin [Pseudomonas granadensis]MBN6830361.1 type II toxin-antitoxin system RelE/ParE family toxin [Pseudomonas granadensis]MBN6837903.1 type II toxin-antitoxin system RelE/ParE family toxin [Pseudomonas granadensis]MBN6867265.1 type II toxin-antitoxin system Re